MTDYQQIVDEIRFALQTEDCELTDNLRQAAQDYVHACREVNLQLRKIAGYLDSGLRSEAIQLAEGPPNLLDAVNTLNFPELADWIDVASVYDLPRSEPLMLGVVEQLNDALVVDQPLQKLMARHRRLALVRAPLRMRLNVLRELRRADPETPCWEEDVRTFERARFAEIISSAKEAQKAGNLESLKQIQAEVSGSKWIEKPPAKILASVKSSIHELTRNSARADVQKIAEQLQAAFAELDLPRARQLRSAWNEVSKRAELPNDDPTVTQLEPVLGWIQDEDALEASERKYNQTIAELESALNSDTTIDELDRMVHEIRRLERDLPEVIATRYRNRRETLLLAQSRRHRLQLGSIAVGLLLAVGLTGFLIRHQLQVREVQQLEHHVAELIKNRQWENARDALEARNDLNRWEGLLSLQAKLDQAMSEDQSRIQQLNHYFERAQSADEHRDAMTALDQAETLVQSEEERLRIESLRHDWNRRQSQQMAAREKIVREQITELIATLAMAEQQLEAGPGTDQTGEDLSEAASQIGQLKARVQGLRPELASQLDLLAARQQQLAELRQNRLEQIRLEEKLTQAALIAPQRGDPTSAVRGFRSSLLAFADSLESEDQAALLRSTADEDPYWRSSMEWARMIQSWPVTWPTNHEQVTARLKAVDAFLKENPGSPDADVAKKYRDQLEARLRRHGLVGELSDGLKQRLQRIYSTSLIADSWELRKKDQGVYYLPEMAEIDPGRLTNFRYYTGYSKDHTILKKGARAEDYATLTAVPTESSRIASFVLETLNSDPQPDWNEFQLQLAQRLFEASNLDPYLQLDLFNRSLEIASAGDVFLADKLSLHRKHLDSLAINPLAKWMVPGDTEGDEARAESARALTQMKSPPFQKLSEIWDAAAEARLQFEADLQRVPLMVGWLKFSDGEWSCQSDWTPDRPHDLRVIFVNADQSVSQWRNIGEAASGTLTINPGVKSFLAPGRPVFAFPRTRETVVQK